MTVVVAARMLAVVPAIAAVVAGAPVMPAPPEPASALLTQGCVSRLPLDVRIGQTMLVITDDPRAARKRLDQGLIAGMLGTGILTRSQAQAFKSATAGTRYGAILGADEEGGPVQRYRQVAGSMPSAAQQSRNMTPEQVRATYARHGAKLAQWGVNVVFAPVADVGRGPGIGVRSYSSDPKVVAKYAAAAAAGYRAAGLLPVAKHFPGHGRVTADTHTSKSIGPKLDELRSVDFIPFKTLIDDSPDLGVMVAHTQIPGYSNMASTQSRQVISGLLRGELGFSGLVISDALGMAAAGTSDQGKALVGFLRAGGDLGIVGPGGAVSGRKAVAAAVKSGQLATSRVDEAAVRVFAAKGVDPCKLDGGAVPRPDKDTTSPSDAPIINPTKDS